MKKKKQKKSTLEIIIPHIQNHILELYFIAMFFIYPFYRGTGFVKMGQRKYEFFRVSAIAMIVCVLLLACIYGIVCVRQKRVTFNLNFVKEIWQKASALDRAVFVYGICATISYLFSDFRAEAWEGANGWFMGMQAQLFFVLFYFLISRIWKRKNRVILYILLGSAGTFILAILHRFMIDPLHMYDGLKEWQILQFLSTLGQATWYSSFVCTIYPIGIYLFWYCMNKKYRILAAVYSVIAFATVVTQNSDSAFISLVLLLLALFWVSFASNEKMKRFLEVLLLMLADFKVMGLLQIIFKDRAIQLDRISTFMSQSVETWIALVVVAGLYVGFCCLEKAGKLDITKWCIVRNITVGVCGAAVLGMIIFVAVNTHNINSGNTEGFVSYNQYLYFDDAWGNRRGSTWKHTADMWNDFSIGQKLIGVGPDCYSAYSYSVPEYAERLQAEWGKTKLTNSHNEWMNIFICYGLLGAIAYISIFIIAIRRFSKESTVRPFVFAIALCALSYMGHNAFCYQQVLCTPFMFILFGIGEAMIRDEKGKEIE